MRTLESWIWQQRTLRRGGWLFQGPSFSVCAIFIAAVKLRGDICQNLFALLAVDLDITSFFSAYLLCFLLVSSSSFRGFSISHCLLAPLFLYWWARLKWTSRTVEENEAVLWMGSGSGSSQLLFRSVTVYFLSFKTSWELLSSYFGPSSLKVGEPKP